jgi:hypothetical protein
MIPSIRAGLDPVVKPARGWKAAVPTWRGVTAKVGRVELLLPVSSHETSPLRPFSLLVLFPDEEPPDSLPYIYLGAQFFLEYRTGVALEYGTDPPSGRLTIP